MPRSGLNRREKIKDLPFALAGCRANLVNNVCFVFILRLDCPGSLQRVLSHPRSSSIRFTIRRVDAFL